MQYADAIKRPRGQTSSRTTSFFGPFDQSRTVGGLASGALFGASGATGSFGLEKLLGLFPHQETSDGGAIFKGWVATYLRSLVQSAGGHRLVAPLVYPSHFLGREPAIGEQRGPIVSIVEQPTTKGQDASIQRLRLEEIIHLTGISKISIAKLIGVSPPTIYAWLGDQDILEKNLRRLLEINDVIKRASVRNRSPQELQAWLYSPRGADAVRPADLLGLEEFDHARLLALSSSDPRSEPIPTWVRESKPEAWSIRENARRSYFGREDQEVMVASCSEDDE